MTIRHEMTPKQADASSMHPTNVSDGDRLYIVTDKVERAYVRINGEWVDVTNNTEART